MDVDLVRIQYTGVFSLDVALAEVSHAGDVSLDCNLEHRHCMAWVQVALHYQGKLAAQIGSTNILAWADRSVLRPH